MVKAFFEEGVAFGNGLVADGVCEGFGGADEDADFLGAGYAGVDEVALEHDEVFHRNGHYHNGELGTLALVDGYCIGERQLVEFGYVVFHKATVERDGERPLVSIDGGYIADVAVEHTLVIVVADLHHLVALTEGIAATSQ